MNNEKKNRVRFFNTAYVILIPCRQEYKDHGLEDFVWYKKSDLFLIKQQAKQQLEIYIKEKGYNMELCDYAAVKRISNELYADPERCDLIDNTCSI